jgi:hypothetical protein
MSSAFNIPAGPEDHEIEDMAHSACQEALSFGLSVDSFMRPLKSLAKKFRAAAPTPPVDAVPDKAYDDFVKWGDHEGPIDAVPGEPVAKKVREEADAIITYLRASLKGNDYVIRGVASALDDLVALAASAASRAGSEPVAMVLVPMHMTDEMEAVTRDDSWQWEDLLAAAGAITEEQYDDIAAGRGAPAPVTTPLAAAAAEPGELTTCNCRWKGEKLVQQCTLHEAWRDAIRDWSERAKVAERQLPDRERAASLVAGEDTKRLDWIESKVCDVSRLGDAARTLRISWNNGADSVFVGPGYSATWREAIDRASAGEAQS